VTPVRAVRVPLGRLAAFGLVVVSVAATSVTVLAEPSLGPYAILAVLVVAFGALALVLAVGSLRRWLGVGTVLALSGGLLLGSALVAVLLWYRRPGSTPEEAQDPDERSEPRAASPA
jgi:membrane-associated phospholipid phosphatase